MSDVNHELKAMRAICGCPLSSKVAMFSNSPSTDQSMLRRSSKQSEKTKDELGKVLKSVKDSPLKSKVEKFSNLAKSHKETQEKNPFSELSAGAGTTKLDVDADEYGRPKKGSLTEYRGKKANTHIYQEMLELCTVIYDAGEPLEEDPELRGILFGDLFQIYTRISNKVAGILLRARKQELLTFEGEMLFQKYDDDVPIFLLKPLDEIKATMLAQIDEVNRNLSKDPKPTTLLK